MFEKLRYKNLLSSGDNFTEITLNEHNLTLIVGDNGSGKSTIVDALTLALYGKPFRKINKPQLTNSINGKGLVVEVEFSVGNKHYKVIRGIKPTIFELYLNEELINQDAGSRDYQEMLEKQILKLNYKAFCQVVILGNASFVPFMQLSAGDRRLIIEELLDLQVFSTMNNLLKLKSSENKTLINECATHIKTNQEKIDLQKQNLAKQGAFIQDQIWDHEEKISDLEEKINILNMSIQKREATLTNLVLENDQINTNQLRIREIELQLNELNTKRKQLEKEGKFYHDHENCPTCSQDIDANFRKEKIKKLKEETSVIDNAIPDISSEKQQLQEDLVGLNAAVELANQINTNINVDKNSLKLHKETVTTYLAKIDKLKTSMQEETTDDNKLKKFEDTLEKLLEANVKMVAKQNIFDVTSVILKDTGVKAVVIKQFVSIINQMINKYLTDLGFFCQFELDETFNETIKSRHRDEFSYASFSEGEKMRINLAILLTWRTIARMRNSASTNLLLMDEVFDSSLDAAGTDFFIKILNQLTSDTNVFIISHKGDQMIDQFENLIQFEKKKNFSQIRGD
jgi:DNA repair exonuclease SbcCD ATPase subunit